MDLFTPAREDEAFNAEGTIKDSYGFTGFTSTVTLMGYDGSLGEWVALASGSDYGWLTQVRSEYVGSYFRFMILDAFGDEADLPEAN